MTFVMNNVQLEKKSYGNFVLSKSDTQELFNNLKVYDCVKVNISKSFLNQNSFGIFRIPHSSGAFIVDKDAMVLPSVPIGYHTPQPIEDGDLYYMDPFKEYFMFPKESKLTLVYFKKSVRF